MQLENIDWLIISAFFVISLLIGVIVSKKSGKDVTEFFLSGRKMPWWLLGISMVATTFSADTPNLVTDIVRTNGVAGNWVWWAFLLTGMLTVFIYAKLWRRSKVLTDLEFYELRYSGKGAAFLRGFRAFYLGAVFNVLIMASVCLAGIKIGGALLGLSPIETLLISCGITVIYSSIGGLRGIIITDFFQFILAMLATFWAAYEIVSLPQIQGLNNLLNHPDVIPKLSLIPDIADRDLFIAVFIIPLAVQWWAVWYPGAEPGGGGYIAQRMLSAKDEKNAIWATLLFNFMHYAVRPWPWILIALASIVVYPNIESLQQAFPNTIVGNDLAYPAMISFLPSGLLGLLVASLIAAFMSTISTHLNWGSSYLVHDFYRRFYVKNKSEKHYVFMGRVFTVLLMILSAFFALFLNNSLQAFGIILQIGAGTGLIFILRWFWYRINVYSELTAMIVSFLVALGFEFLFPNNLSVEEKLIIGVTITTICWFAVTLITPPSNIETLQNFYKKIQPGGPGWKKIIDISESNGIKIVGKKEKWDVPTGILCMVFGSISVYSILFGIGYILYSQTTTGLIFILISVVSVFILMKFWKRLSS
ncbi:MAG: Na+:solute symporter [Flavobacteriaceae bacterium]|nr:Na+:solute symporter [Flavobacteriaceae bacterium]MDA0331267.1 Na+:solute symporter [Bacteroidota bacterium]MDA2947405.1 Na+:solute symporter [Actinomycetota bacterium]